MQITHRRRQRPFRPDGRDRSLGVVIVEAAFVTPVFFMLVLGIMEVGLAMNDKLALANTVRAATRVASASGNDVYADYNIIQAVKRESAAIPRSQIVMVVIYKADNAGEPPTSSCQGGTGAPGVCNVYRVADLSLPKIKYKCTEANSPARFYCPTTRDVIRAGGTDYVGVWMKVEHPWLTRMFGNTVILTDTSVIRLEPRLR